MSRSFKKSSVAPSKKPYCKVCHDAGKPESVYTSHWVKTLPDRNGKSTITCETLLSVECRWCFQIGHTAGYCPILKANNKEKERIERAKKAEEAKNNKPAIVATKKPASIFAVLAEDSSDSESEVQIKEVRKPVSKQVTKNKANENIKMVVEEFPALCKPANKIEAKNGWCDAVAKPKPEPVPEFNVKVTYVPAKKEVVKNEEKIAYESAAQYEEPVRILPSYRYIANWADDSSDEEDAPQQEIKKGFVVPEWNDDDW